MNKPRFTLALLHPKYWLTWIGFVFFVIVVNLLPLSVLHKLGDGLGKLLVIALKKRGKISKKNIALCLPELSQAEQERIYIESIQAAGRSVFESGIAWFCPKWRLKNMYTIQGLEHLQALGRQENKQDSKNNQQGAILVGLHFTTLDICGAFLNISASVDSFYRPNFNQAFDYIQHRGRERFNQKRAAIPKQNIRETVKKLKQGRVIIYVPDQDYGSKHSLFVPFFNIPTATVTATSQLAQMGKAKILSYTSRWNKQTKKYEITIFPPFENMPSTNVEQDITEINQFIEQQVRINPEQYLWSHRRFKTRPDGEQDFYRVETEKYRQKREKEYQLRKAKK